MSVSACLWECWHGFSMLGMGWTVPPQLWLCWSRILCHCRMHILTEPQFSWGSSFWWGLHFGTSTSSQSSDCLFDSTMTTMLLNYHVKLIITWNVKRTELQEYRYRQNWQFCHWVSHMISTDLLYNNYQAVIGWPLPILLYNVLFNNICPIKLL